MGGEADSEGPGATEEGAPAVTGLAVPKATGVSRDLTAFSETVVSRCGAVVDRAGFEPAKA